MTHFSQLKICIGCGTVIGRLTRNCTECRSDQFVQIKSMVDALVLPGKVAFRLNKMLSPKNGNGFSERSSDE
jgi:hypothetical protein